MTGRNRSEGWTHAKLSGHALEEQLASALEQDVRLSSTLHQDCFGTPNSNRVRVYAGGIDASHGTCVLGGVTPSKTDLRVAWPGKGIARISLKKSTGGQVWLVTPERFVAGFEAQFETQIPDPVRLGLRLFVGPVEAPEMRQLLNGAKPHGPTRTKDGKSQEFHQERFVADTLKAIIPDAWAATLDWLRSELPRIAELCFAKGLCSEKDSQADFVWYHIIDETTGQLVESRIFEIAEIIRSISALPMLKRAAVGPRNGGSTITLPFGFLQMHRPAGGNQVQFHHGLNVLKETLGV